MSVTVRGATADDARAIAEVHVASWRWAYRGQVPDRILDELSVDEREAIWRAALHNDLPRRERIRNRKIHECIANRETKESAR